MKYEQLNVDQPFSPLAMLEHGLRGSKEPKDLRRTDRVLQLVLGSLVDSRFAYRQIKHPDVVGLRPVHLDFGLSKIVQMETVASSQKNNTFG